MKNLMDLWKRNELKEEEEEEDDVEATKLELLRLALARNLAMAIVKEGTVQA